MKKFLSMVLVLVMTMSLVTVSAGAEDFTDDGKITYEEAVDVMSAIGVVSGYADGSFKPQDGLTRGAAAKIICNMILGPTTAGALSANEAPYKDVAANSTFAGYIAYCANEGIISGYADGTFRPAAPLTGYAFMKMLLGALGYDADIEKYTGSNWSIQVAKRALNIGLDDDLVGEFVGANALTREEACLYAFNALNAETVQYDSKSSVSVGDITITQNSEAKGTDILFREKYFEKLKKNTTNVTDDFGRPAHTWKNDKTEIGTYTDSADYVVVLDDSYDTLKDLVKYVLDETDDDLNADKALAAGIWFNGAEGVKVDEKLLANAKTGAVIELFVDDDEVVTDIVGYTYELAEIESVSTKISSAAEKKGAEYAVKLDGIGTYYDAYDKDDSKVLPGFDADTYTEGTQIAIVRNGSTIIDSYVAETVSGEINSYEEDGYVKIDGTKYICAGNATTGELKFDKEYTLYLDANGYVLKVDGDTSTSIDDVYYITGVYMETSSKGSTAYYAEAVSLDGMVTDVVLNSDHAATKVLTDKAVANKFVSAGVAGLYTLTLNSDDEYEVAAFTSDDADYDVKAATLSADVKKDASSVTLSSKVYLDDETQYISIKTKADGNQKEVKTAVGGMSMVKGVQAIAITKDGEKDALYVLYIGTTVSSSVDTGNVLFVSAKSTEKDSKDTYLTKVVFMEDNMEDSISVETNSAYEPGFYTYSINDDGNYELKVLDQKKTPVEVDEDWEGWTNIIFKDADIHNNAVSYVDGSINMEDIDFSGAAVIDLRDEGEVDAGKWAYDRTITSVSDLKDAAEEVANGVHTMVYVIDGEITFVAVTTNAYNK